MLDVQSLRELHAHLEWADARLWSAVHGNDQAARDAGIREKLVHIHVVQRVYLNTWTRRPWWLPTPEDVRDLRAVWHWAHPYYGDAKAFFDTVTPETLAEPLPEAFARRIEADLGAGASCPTVAESAFQVVSHSTHHRGQLNTCLRELGAEPPAVDYILWVWLGRPAAAWTPPTTTPPSDRPMPLQLGPRPARLPTGPA